MSESVLMSDAKRIAVARSRGTSIPLRKISVNVERPIAQRVKRMAFEHAMSESIIVELALKALFAGRQDAEVAADLKKSGARLRRR